MSAGQRAKGIRGENEARKLLWEQLGDIVQPRDLSQTRDGGGDIRIPEARVLVEVKRCERRSVPAWLRQAAESAKTQGDGWVGVVMWRRNMDPWSVYRPLPPGERVHGQSSYGYQYLEAPEFCDWVRGRL